MGVFLKDGDDDDTGKTTQNRRCYHYYYNYNPNYYYYFYYYHHYHHHHYNCYYQYYYNNYNHYYNNYYNYYKGSICIYGARTGRRAKKKDILKQEAKTLTSKFGLEGKGGKQNPSRRFYWYAEIQGGAWDTGHGRPGAGVL